MTDRICSIDACERKVKARGLCWKHYQEWRSSEPSELQPYTHQGPSCVEPGCTADSYAKNLCRPHYRALSKYGSTTPRRRAEVVAGCRVCPRCKLDRPLAEWGAANCCKACNRDNARRYVKPTVTGVANCATCGVEFGTNNKKKYHCSPECERVGRHRRNIKHVQLRRARKRGATTESFAPSEVFNRDGWICQLCLTAICPDLKAPHPHSVSLDHVIPLSRGGEHTRANTQAAHLGCNVRKGSRLP